MDETISTLRIEIGATPSAKAVSEINRVSDALRNLRQAASGRSGGFAKLADELRRLGDAARGIGGSMGAASKALQRLANLRAIRVPRSLGDSLRNIAQAAQAITPASAAGVDSMARALKNLAGVKGFPALSGFKIPEIPASAGEAITSIADAAGRITPEQLQNLDEFTMQMQRLENVDLSRVLASLNAINRSRTKVRVDATDADRARKKVGLLANVLKSMGRIAFYRAIRSAIKLVTDAFREGEDEAYWYSKTTGEQTRYISQAYDALASSGAKLKNQLGAALASLMAAASPLLLKLAELATMAANALTQLFAVLGGKTTYMRAKDVTKAWADETERGAGAAKEWKNQLLGFDEINRLEEPSGGGGGGSSLPDYGSLFEEVEIDAWAEKVKGVIDWVKDHFEIILPIVTGIGAALLAWKLAPGLLGSLGSVAGGTGLLGKLNQLRVLAGLGLTIGGGALFYSGAKEWAEAGELIDSAFFKMEGGLAGLGVGLSLLTKSWIPLAVAALGGLGLAAYKAAQDIAEGAGELIKWRVEVNKAAKESGDVIQRISFRGEVQTLPNTFEGRFAAEWLKAADEKYKKELREELARRREMETGAFGDYFARQRRELEAQIKSHDGFLSKLLEKHNETLGRLLQGDLYRLQNSDGPVGKLFNKSIQNLESFAQKYANSSTPIFSAAGKGIEALLDKYQLSSKKLSDSADASVSNAKNAAAAIEKAYGGIKLPRLKAPQVEGLDAMNGAAQTIGRIKQAFEQAGESVIESMGKIGRKIGDLKNVIPDFRASARASFLGFAEDARTAQRDASRSAEAIFRAFNLPQIKIQRPKIPQISVEAVPVFGALATKFGITAMPRFRVDWFANGGFPEDGLFMANHGELVGQFSNGKNAVANNEQIEAGIEEAAYRGFMRAIANSSDQRQSSSGGDIVLNVNGREFARATYRDYQAASREAGMTLINNFA